jgi:soluble cytochrome b562
MNAMLEFAKELDRVSDELHTYSRNLVRASGGDDTDDSEYAYRKSSILAEVAKAARKASESVPPEPDSVEALHAELKEWRDGMLTALAAYDCTPEKGYTSAAEAYSQLRTVLRRLSKVPEAWR